MAAGQQLGYCEALLFHLKNIAQTGYPGQKVTQQGFLRMLLEQPDRPSVLQDALGGGHRRDIRIKYKQRSTEAQVGTSEDCDIDLVPAYKETTATAASYAGINLHIADDTLRMYCEDATAMVSGGGLPTSLMAEHLDSILSAMNGIYAKMETVLTTDQALYWGVNRRTGLKTSTNVNFNLNGTTNNFQESLPRMLADYQINEFCGSPNFVYNGNFHMYDLQKGAGALSYNQSGVNNSVVMPYNGYFSQKTASTWGDNVVGVFEPGSVHLLENMRNVGAFAGQKGAVQLGTFYDPRVQCWSPKGMSNMQFDIMLKYIDCPTSFTNGYLGSATYQKGWFISISKYYGIFHTPADAYDGGDVLAGVNGTLKYVALNA